MNLFKKSILQSLALLMLLTIVSFPAFVQAKQPLDISTTPLSTSGPTVIKPNMLYVLDDSGSMARTFMPDWVGILPGTSNTGWSKYNAYLDDPSLNTLAYDPAVRYQPPAYFNNSGTKNTTTYPSMTGRSTATGARDWGTLPNWERVKRDAYLSNSTVDIDGRGSYTVSIPHEFCTNVDLKVCIKADFPTETHPYPAPLRWCKSKSVAEAEALPATGQCQAVRIEGEYDEHRFPKKPQTVVTAYEATITITSIGGIFDRTGARSLIVNGQQIMSGATSTTYGLFTSASEVAGKIVDKVNDCTNSAVGNCTITGYSARQNNNEITIVSTGDEGGARPTLTTSSGYIAYNTTPFSLVQTVVAGGGLDRVNVNIQASNNSYPYPGTTVRHPNRTDCVINETTTKTCTYVEEMTNYANWYAYYRTRMQMMKTSTSLAFEDVGDDLRMGFMTINTHSSKSLDFRDFSGASKKSWYDKLFDISANGGTPLREALANAGRIYAKKYTAGNTFTDPIQYECQQNFTLLTTDGLWNGNNGRTVNGGSLPNLDNVSTEKGKYEGSTAVTGQLADVAKYYRDTDLRTPRGSNGNTDFDNCTGALGTNVCSTAGTSPALNLKQSMVTLTLGLGVDGTLAYDVDYGPSRPGDFKDIYDGHMNWPEADDDAPETIDDLWHAAVNGDGRYFSAKKTRELVDQLREAIALIKVKTGAGAAAATSTLNPVAGDNFAYVASYTTGSWSGNLEKREIDLVTGEVSKAALVCVEDVVQSDSCAAPKEIQAIGQNADGGNLYFCVEEGVTDQADCTETLVGSECRVPIAPSCTGTLANQASRTIYMNNGGALASLDIANFTATQAYNYAKDKLVDNLTQGKSLNSDQLDNLTGDNVVKYIAGDKTYEANSPLLANQVFRKRTTVLGDLIDSKPSFIGKPTFNYGDSGYQDFKSEQATRAGIVYVGSNDGMLHAFDAETLQERWAFVPSAVVPNLWKLADSNYSAEHRYFVNGDVVISDICVASDCAAATKDDWKTILVAGLDAGGRGYYALDITTPTAPKLLWEIDPKTDADFNNLGYTYGNPIVTKRAGDEKWVVLFTSGYNNIPDNYNGFYEGTEFDPDPNDTNNYFNTGDGGGYLFVVDASSGNRLATISTGKGSQSSPSGLAKISAYSEYAETNNVSTYVYGGDLDGNLWRFNIEASKNSRVHLATFKDAANQAQPMMTAPVLGEINKKKIIFVGTGQYLEKDDLNPANFSTQSLYAFKDTANDSDTGPVLANPRTALVNQSIIPDPDDADRRKVIGSPFSFSSGTGWYLDFPDSGERQNVAAQLVLGTLLVPTTVPTATPCQPAGYGWFNYFDYRTGAAVPRSSGLVSQRTSSPSVGFNVVYIDGKPKVSNVTADDPNPSLLEDVPFDIGTGEFQFKRSIWREILD